MFSIPCSYSAAAPRHGLPRLAAGAHSSDLFLPPPPPFTKPRPTPRPINAVGANHSRFDPRDQQQQQQLRTLFPGGFKRPEIKVPTLVLRLSAEEVLGRAEAAAEVSRAVSGGVGIVVLHGGDESGGRLYEAACVLRPVIGDRAYFLIAERVDVATAVGASGVVLSDQGIPAIVARNMMMKSRSDSIYLPLVARTVRTGKSAVSASSSEGADFLIMGTGGENYVNVMEHSVAKQVKVPIFFTIKSNGESSLFTTAQELFQLGACGLVASLHDVKLFSDDVLRKLIPSKHVLNGIMQDQHSATNRLEVNDVRNALNMKKGFAGFTKLNDKEVQLVEAERLLLKEAVAVIHKAAPMMKDVLLLEDAASRLTEPFLLVVVGEFNSGKSTVINALLGRKYLKEGVVPTTNEITLLCYSETDYNEEERCQRNPDGQFVCYLSAPILKEMNLVDTPGTNVILQRQQQLTEEFVPRADLILFVLSSDRPLTESEVAFLLYVQQWKKKVVFVLNKLDLYQNTDESEEAIAFIRENAQKLLNTEDIRLYPVSARSALYAKLSASTYDGRNHEEILLNDPFWLASRFDDFEKFLFSFMDGSTDTGMERMRLKLETPIGIAERLLLSCEKLVKQDYELASQNLISMMELVNSAQEYAMKMENESILWKKQTSSLIEKAKTRAIKLMESILQLSNVDLIATYAFKAERSNAIAATSAIQNDIISPAISDAQKLLEEYSLWLESSIARERKHFTEAFRERWHESIDVKDRMQPETYALFTKGEALSISVIENFSAIAASRLFEQEVREVVLGTFGGVGAAGLSASLLTSVLPTTLEDLLALAFCSAGGLLAISKFSSRRDEAVRKVCRVADGLARDIEEAMQKDLLQAIEKLTNFVEVISKPYNDAAQHKINKLLEIQEDLANIQKKLEAMKVEIQNLHLS